MAKRYVIKSGDLTELAERRKVMHLAAATQKKLVVSAKAKVDAAEADYQEQLAIAMVGAGLQADTLAAFCLECGLVRPGDVDERGNVKGECPDCEAKKREEEKEPPPLPAKISDEELEAESNIAKEEARENQTSKE